MFHVEQNKKTIRLAVAKDHLVSGEVFEIHLDKERQIAHTHPAPEEEALTGYYQSEDYISHGNQHRTFLDRLYRKAQQWMFSKKENWLSRHSSKDKTYLDFGCGTGDFVDFLNQKGWSSYGVEPSEKARSFIPSRKNLFANEKELPNQAFDVIGLWHVLEHLPSPKQQLEELELYLKEEGVFIFALPNFNSFDARHYQDYWAAYDVPRHLWHFSAVGISKLMQELNYKLIGKRGLFFDAYYVSYLSEKQQKKSFPFVRGIFWGLLSNLTALFTGEYSSLVYVFQRKV